MTRVAVIGGGPAGLMAADVLSAAGVAVTVFERMPSVGRKLLIAGRGGLNLTHSEPLEDFLGRYGAARGALEGPVTAFPPDALRAFAATLGEETFVGSSGRVFPKSFKASPLLRAWLARLAAQGVEIRTRMRWLGWDAEGRLLFERADPSPPAGRVAGRSPSAASRSTSAGIEAPTLPSPAGGGGMAALPAGEREALAFDAIILALGGGSWGRLGSDAAWVPLLAAKGVEVVPLAAANAGVVIGWSDHIRARFAGTPLKGVALAVGGASARGEAVVTRGGLEGGAVYALGPAIRAALAGGDAVLTIDLKPDVAETALARRLARPRGGQSMANHLRKAANLAPVAAALLREAGPLPADPAALAARIKRLGLPLTGTAGIERAISTAGGIALGEIDGHFMLKRMPGVFVAGEMLDWEAPTGGYLLQGAFATGAAAARGVLAWLGEHAAA